MNNMLTIHEILRMPFDGGRVVGITTYRDDVLIATEERIYCLRYDSYTLDYSLFPQVDLGDVK